MAGNRDGLSFARSSVVFDQKLDLVVVDIVCELCELLPSVAAFGGVLAYAQPIPEWISA